MMDLVEKLASSGNKILEAAANDWSKWSKLKHSKIDLEFFLKNNIAHIRFKPLKAAVMKDIVCTSNTKFIAMFSAIKESQKKKALASRKVDGIHTDDLSSVLTFNLIDNKYNTIDLTVWEIVAFISITDDNIELLDEVANELLKKKIEKDIHSK